MKLYGKVGSTIIVLMVIEGQGSSNQPNDVISSHFTQLGIPSFSDVGISHTK